MQELLEAAALTLVATRVTTRVIFDAAVSFLLHHFTSAGLMSTLNTGFPTIRQVTISLAIISAIILAKTT